MNYIETATAYRCGYETGYAKAIDEAVKVLEKYGQHKPDCRVYAKDPCKCGFDEALSQLKE